MGVFVIIIVSVIVLNLIDLLLESISASIARKKAITKKIQEIDSKKLTMVDLLAYTKTLAKAEED